MKKLLKKLQTLLKMIAADLAARDEPRLGELDFTSGKVKW